MKWNRIFVTGDCHGQFHKIKEFTEKAETTLDDLLIIVGDVGVNYNQEEQDRNRKNYLSKLPISFLMIKGNHDARPETVPNMCYSYHAAFSANVYFEKEYSNIYYINAGVFQLNGQKCLAIGGAYSVDKYYRLEFKPLSWFYDEQPNAYEKAKIKDILEMNKEFNFVFTHTCPIDLVPRHLFLSSIDQSKVDTSTEEFLQEVYNQIKFKKWYCGHYHGDEWLSNSVRMLYAEVVML